MQSAPEASPPSNPELKQAPHVCRSCKARKRKCDKALPACSPCARRKVTCNYGRLEAPSAVGLRQSHPSVSLDGWPFSPVSQDEYDQPELDLIDYPTALFLDPALLQHGQLNFAWSTAPVPPHLRDLLGTVDDIRFTVNKYLEHIHLWLPFISKSRLQSLYQRSSLHTHADIVLLLLALKLITTPPPLSPRNSRTSLYRAIKHFYLEVEGSPAFSLPILQAGVILALYEIAHGIYPAAFLSIAGCARFAHAIGIHVSRVVNSRKVLTLVEVEERRRVWWAIVILDRFVSIGCPGRPLATADPEIDDLLPANDAAWDEGIINPDQYSTISAPLTGHMSKFALLCQAARLLGQVLSAVSNGPASCDDTWLQLNRTLQSMLAASLDVENPDYDRITFVYSALTALNTPWFPDDVLSAPDNERAQHARLFVHQLTDKINTNLVESECLSNRDPEEIPPWGLFFAYRVCVTQVRSRYGLPSDEVPKALRASLLRIDARWNAAGTYLQLLEAQEVMSSS